MLVSQVCPLCAANLGKDVIGHFILQHASLLKVLLQFWFAMLRHIFCFVFNRKRKMFLCSEEENLINLASIVLIQQCSAKSSQHILWETSMILHLIHYSHRLSTICLFWTLKASLKMNALETMPPPRLM